MAILIARSQFVVIGKFIDPKFVEYYSLLRLSTLRYSATGILNRYWRYVMDIFNSGDIWAISLPPLTPSSSPFLLEGIR